MTDQPQFRTVLRGLDPDQVASAIKELHTSLVIARRTAADRTVDLASAQQEVQRLPSQLDAAQARAAELESAGRPFAVGTVVALKRPASARPGAPGSNRCCGRSGGGTGGSSPRLSGSTLASPIGWPRAM